MTDDDSRLRRALEEKLAETRVRMKRWIREKEEAERKLQIEKEGEDHILGTLEYLGVEHTYAHAAVDIEQTIDPPSVSDVAAINVNGSVTKQRQRLPRGFVEKIAKGSCENEGRFLHISELLTFVNAEIERRWPDQPHLLTARRGLSRPVLRLFESGDFVRVQYGESPNFIFHGLPRFLTEIMGQRTFAQSNFAPRNDLLPNTGDTPQFHVANQTEMKKDNAQELK